VSVWIIFAICFTTLLVGTLSSLTILEFYRAEKRVREAELREAARVRGELAG
jgi:hypothetical protein